MNLFKKPLLITITALFALGLLSSNIAKAETNPFASANLMSITSDHAQGKCGETKAESKGKCGEGKCGETKAKVTKKSKCGEGKCGEAKAKTTKKSKCGEGKCGEGKTKKCGG
jgi:uncharacterized low-complexity protein